MDYFKEFIKPELLILIPVLYLVGAGIKKSESIKDKHIPATLGAVGVLLALSYVFSVEPINGIQAILAAAFTAITQGILCAGASVYVNQLIKQAGKPE